MKMKKQNRKLMACALLGAFFLSCIHVAAYAQSALNATIDVPGDYVCADTHIGITIMEQEGLVIRSIKYKADEGEYRDITSKKYFTVDNNCKVTVKIQYTNAQKEEEEEEINCEINNFDGVKPEVNASVKGEVLTIMATDDLSGVRSISINGNEYTELTEGNLSINIKELEKTDNSFTIFATDKAGNNSPTYKIKNPYYVENVQDGTKDQSLNNSDSTEATDPTNATATVVDYGEGKDGKEFYTIRTDSDKTFYLVVDRNEYDKNVHLLTEVGENDLLNFVTYDGNTVRNGDVPVYTVMDEKGNEETAEDETKKERNTSSYFVYIIAAGIVILLYLRKSKKGKTIKNGDVEDEENMNEPL